MTAPRLYVYYCKCLKETGRPIIISNGKSEITTDNLILEGVSGKMRFNNTSGKAKARGATTLLEISLEE